MEQGVTAGASPRKGQDAIWDVAVIGAGAAGMMAAATAGRHGARTILLDHAEQPGRKILISGGGRCNFTNLRADWTHYHSANPRFCRSALARYRPQDFLALVSRHRIRWHEKEEGQLFCDESARQIVTMLEDECRTAKVRFQLGCSLRGITHDGQDFTLEGARGAVRARSVILATGGLALPKLGATDFSLRVARQFGLRVVPPAPALVPLRIEGARPELAGVSLPVAASFAGRKKPVFTGGMVFTHRGGVWPCDPTDFLPVGGAGGPASQSGPRAGCAGRHAPDLPEAPACPRPCPAGWAAGPAGPHID